MKSEVYEEKVNTTYELVARIKNSAALIKKERQDDLRIATRTVAKRFENCIEVDGGIFERLFLTAEIYCDHLYNQQMQSLCHLFSFICFVRLFMRNIQTALSSHPLKIGHMFIWTHLLGRVHTTTS